MNSIVRFLRKLQILFGRKKFESELEEEMAFHREQAEKELQADGISPEAAKYAARRRLGNPTHLKEQTHDVVGFWFESLLQDLRYAFRTLRKQPGFAAVALLTLALGTGVTTVMFTVVNGVLLKPLSYPEPERLITLHGHTEKYGDQWGISYPNVLDLRRESRSLAGLAAWGYSGDTVSAPGQAEYVDGRQVSSGLFSVFGVTLLGDESSDLKKTSPGVRPQSSLATACGSVAMAESQRPLVSCSLWVENRIQSWASRLRTFSWMERQTCSPHWVKTRSLAYRIGRRISFTLWPDFFLT